MWVMDINGPGYYGDMSMGYIEQHHIDEIVKQSPKGSSKMVRGICDCVNAAFEKRDAYLQQERQLQKKENQAMEDRLINEMDRRYYQLSEKIFHNGEKIVETNQRLADTNMRISSLESKMTFHFITMTIGIASLFLSNIGVFEKLKLWILSF